MDGQLRLLKQQKTRIIWRINKHLSELGGDQNYLAAILHRMSSEAAIPLHTDLQRYEFSDL